MNARIRIRGALAAVLALALTGLVAMAGCASEPVGSAKGSAGATSSDARGSYEKITADKGADLMREGSPVIVDVRTAREYADGHIPGAINIPVESIGAEKPAQLIDTNAELIAYCRTGVRSKQASDKLLDLGYQQVRDMGGIVDWHGDTVTGAEPGTL